MALRLKAIEWGDGKTKVVLVCERGVAGAEGETSAVSVAEDECVMTGVIVELPGSMEIVFTPPGSPSTATPLSSFVKVSARLTMTRCDFVAKPRSEALGYTVFEVSGATLGVAGSTLKGFEFETGQTLFSLAAVENTCLRMETVTLSSITLEDTSLIAVAEDADSPVAITLDSSHFSGITLTSSTANQPAVLSASRFTGTVTIADCDFDTCTAASSTKGGAIRILTGTALNQAFTITGTSFTHCACNTETGKGGAVCLDDSSLDTDAFTFG